MAIPWPLSNRVPKDAAPNAWARRLAERRACGARLVDLTESNPTRVGLSALASEELLALADPQGARYDPDPRGLLSARRAVAAIYADRGLAIDPDDVILTASTSEAYAHLFRLLASAGDEIVAPAPSYPLFEPLAQLEGVRLTTYRLAYDGHWHLDRGSLESAVTARTRAVILVQPNNPTGSCLSDDERRWLQAFCERRGLAILCDEVFGDFPRPGGVGGPSLAGASSPVPTFVLGGLSKSCGLPQIKLAWIVCGGPAEARARALQGLEWIADLFLSVSTPAQLALPRLREVGPPFRARVRERLAINRAALEGLTRERPAIDLPAADGGWSAVLRVPRIRDEDAWVLELLARDVVVHPGHFYDFASEPYLVLSLLPEPRAFACGLEAIASLAVGD